MEGVCKILLRLEGLNEDKIPEYQECLRYNNINGMVLCNCELPELKGVMNMTFGDWELFRAMVENLREDNPDDISSRDTMSPHIRNFTQEMHSASGLEHPKVTRKGRGKRDRSKSPEPGTSKVGRFVVRPVVQKRKMKDGTDEPPGRFVYMHSRISTNEKQKTKVTIIKNLGGYLGCALRNLIIVLEEQSLVFVTT